MASYRNSDDRTSQIKRHDKCPNCGWVLSDEPDQAAPPPGTDPLLVPIAERVEYLSPLKKSRTADNRRHKRVSMKCKAAIRAKDGEDVVDVLDMSRNGVRFFSSRLYAPGMLVQVAVPYTVGSNNIFSMARILRAHRRPTATVAGEYALEILS